MRIEIKKPGQNLWHNRYRYLINHVIGDPAKYPSDQSKGHIAASDCVRCGGLFFWPRVIVVKYGEKVYERDVYCINCFERLFPKWKLILLRHFPKLYDRWKWPTHCFQPIIAKKVGNSAKAFSELLE